MKTVRKMGPVVMGTFLVFAAICFTACNKSPSGSLLGPDDSQQVILHKKGKVPNNSNSTLLLVRVRDDDENGVSRAEIGPDGGVLVHAGHQVEVPAGALGETVELSFSMPLSDTLMFDLQPDGTHFDLAINLVLSYDHAVMEGIDAESLVIVVWNPATQTWDAISSSVDTEANEVRGETTHFSRYALSKG
ncbi:MAG: hypothetical protein ACE5IY_07730 [bacterium]